MRATIRLLIMGAAVSSAIAGPAELVLERDVPRGWTDPEPTALRSRPIELDRGLLAELVRDERSRLRLTPFDGVSFVVDFGPPTRTAQGATVRHGVPVDVEQGSALLVVQEDAVVIDVRTPQLDYEVRSLPGGGRVVREIDRGLYAPCGAPAAPPVPPPVSRLVALSPGPNGCTDDGSSFDLLVVYTPAARSAAGGTNAMNALITSFVATTNQAYQNSGITTLANLVGTSEVVYVEAGNGLTDLNRIKDPSDGYMDGVHGLRDSLDADLVALIVNSAPGICGIASFAITTGNIPVPENGYSVTVRACGGHVFAHEVGHNQGCHHDWGETISPGAFDYSKGYREPGGAFRTIMAYGNEPRITNFSNPNVSSQGLPTGVPIGQPEPADNATSINQTALNVANLRCSFYDCNGNSIEDVVDVQQGTSLDCNGNDVPDECEVDCNGNAIPDECDILNLTSEDCQQNGVPDECDFAVGELTDCNGNTLADICEIADGVTPDCNLNDTPDDCETNDCNNNGVPDDCDLETQTSADCNLDAEPDECNIASGSSLDTDLNTVPDECDDCNGNAVLDSVDIGGGSSLDQNGDTIPDECERIENLDRRTFHATFDLALAVAGDGETIEAAPGIYRETVDFQGTNALVRSAAGPEMTVIDASALGGSVVRFVSGEGQGAGLEGFTLTGGSGSLEPDGSRYGGGIWVNGSSPNLVNLIVRDNTADYGAGVAGRGSSFILMTNGLVVDNDAVLEGGGFYVYENVSPFVSNVVIHGNTAGSAGGAIATQSVGLPYFRNSIIRGNVPAPVAGPYSLIVNTNIEGGPLTNGNIDVDPSFVDAAAGNFRLRAGSPCIDGGSDDSLPLDSTDTDRDGDTDERLPHDLDGKQRSYDGDQTGGDVCDMGAYEFRVPGPPPIDGLTAERLDPAGTSVRVDWGGACPPAGTTLLYGPLDEVATHTLAGAICSASGPQVWQPPAGSVWFVAVPDDGLGTEGSWGRATHGERNGLQASGICGQTVKELGGVCP